MNIRLSPKHGVNPVLTVCPLCGKETGEIALLGKLKGDAEAPMHMYSDAWCSKCAENLSKGLAVMECTDEETQLRLGESAYGTGRYVVIKKDSDMAKRILEKNPNTRIALMAREDYQPMFGDIRLDECDPEKE